MNKLLPTKTRFCPSPTGMIHLGNLRTALFNALYAFKEKGTFLLRIEDTDRTRSRQTYIEGIKEDLRWLDLQWQEGPEADKGNGPYFQSERQGIYDKFYQILEEKGLAYPCFLSKEQLALRRKLQLSQGKPPKYDGYSRHLSKEAIAEQLKKGLKPVLRFRVPDDEEVVFHDWVKGEVRFKTQEMGDFVIRRADGTAPFMFCNAIDDALMKVSHVLRGDDHLTNTPRQIMLLKALDLPVPGYGHISLILGPDGSPLSKRHGSRSITELREAGFLPLALLNYLARLGHYYSQDNLMSLSELASRFELTQLGNAAARFDEQQLLYWQHEAVQALDDENLREWLGDKITSQIPADKKQTFIKVIRPNINFPADAGEWVSICFSQDLVYTEAALNSLQTASGDFFQVVIKQIAENADFETVVDALKKALNVKGKTLFMPLRAALTGKAHGPELRPLWELIPREIRKDRFERF